ncbi:hypothetical protein [Chitinophaga nivalis]|uniref:DUF4265 domain-containing protein n=1 Tax=Chitinophaga nivalis TaxID=2991709 RepID=A0ABT3IRA5_9BACT|nr:hypothetical protein [Chitinophaga nivalis]MCW3463899.1 hypothetical protein [Chitinophaga nivalis]MCW3486411.1 hypothetical protein [Chitinophaga nivalis]
MTTEQFNRSDKMQLIRAYLSAPSGDFFETHFFDTSDIVMWIDWGDEEDDMVRYCENVLHTGHLRAEVNALPGEEGWELIIDYKGKTHRIHLTATPQDRDDVLLQLNRILNPDYQVRFCNVSDGSDSLAFLPLTLSQWASLEQEFPEQVEACFTLLSEDHPLFS